MKKTIGGYITNKGKSVEHTSKNVWTVRGEGASYWLFDKLADVKVWEADGEPETHPLAYW